MKRRINSTGRKPIKTDMFSIVLEGAASGIRSFSADLSGLTTLSLDPAARVYVEPYATRSSAMMRFSFGSLGQIKSPENTLLTELDAGGTILFRIKIVDESGDVGKILAAAKALRPIDASSPEDQRQALLPLLPFPLGEAIWQLDMDGGAKPQLQVNSEISGLVQNVKNDPVLQGAILPHAIRIILDKIMKDGYEDDGDEWPAHWRKWASILAGREPPDDDEETSAYINEVMDRFVRQSEFATRSRKLIGAENDGPDSDP